MIKTFLYSNCLKQENGDAFDILEDTFSVEATQNLISGGDV